MARRIGARLRGRPIGFAAGVRVEANQKYCPHVEWPHVMIRT